MQSGLNSKGIRPQLPTQDLNLALKGHPALRRLETWAATNDQLQLTLRDAATLACVELHYFSAIFRKHTGSTFIEWRRATRAARAVTLIADGTLSVDQIVHAVGYKDRRSLERALKQLMGTTPSALRGNLFGCQLKQTPVAQDSRKQNHKLRRNDHK